MKSVSLATVGAVCALATVGCFVLGIALMVSSGVQVLIPETGKNGLDWIDDVDNASGLFFVGAWLVIFGGLLGVVALVGFYDALQEAGRVVILGPILGAVGLTLVTISHLLPIAAAYELVPDYVNAAPATRTSVSATFDAFAITSLVLNYAGDFLLWGVGVPLYSVAILKTKTVRRWIGWLGLVVAVFAGWLGLLSPASNVVDGLTFIGFVSFFVFMASMGVALLRRKQPSEPAAAAAHGTH